LRLAPVVRGYGRILTRGLGYLDLLRKLFTSISITDCTYREVVEEGRALGKAGVSAVEQAIEEGWMRFAKLEPHDVKAAARLARSEPLDEGDAKAIILAAKLRTALVTIVWCKKAPEFIRGDELRLRNISINLSDSNNTSAFSIRERVAR
jgi:hypothetical protein